MTGGDIRPGEITASLPPKFDFGLYALGRLRTPWTERTQCPKRGDPVNGPTCRVEIDPPWRPALAGLDGRADIELLYWMHLARRDLVQQRPRTSDRLFGTFLLRSPMRPNPIAASVVALVAVAADHLLVRGLDCVDGTPLLDIKPVHCPMWSQGQDHR